MIKVIGFALCALALFGLVLHALGVAVVDGYPATDGKAPEGAVMRQSEFPCHEDEALMFGAQFGTEHVGCVNLEDIDNGVASYDVENKHHARPYVDPADQVHPRKLTRYIASHVREMNRTPWHRIGNGPLAGCAQHVGNTTWVVCRDGSVYAS